MNRSDALTAIIRFSPDRDEAFSVLLEDSQDSSAQAVAVTRTDLSALLKRYLIDELDGDDLEEWAMLIDCRDEIDQTAIEDYLYALSNPELMGGINSASIKKMVTLLDSEEG